MHDARAITSYLPRRWGLFVGNSALFAWTTALFSSPILSGGVSYMRVHVWAMLAVVVFALGLAAIASRKFSLRAQTLGAVAFAVCGTVSTWLIVLESAGGREGGALVVLAFLLAAAVSTWATVAWQVLMARGGIRSAVLLLVGSSAFGFVVYLLLMGLPEAAGRAVAALLPLTACLLVPVASRVCRRTPVETSVPGASSPEDILEETAEGSDGDGASPEAAPDLETVAGTTERLGHTGDAPLSWLPTAPFRLLAIVAVLSLVNGLARTSGSLANLGFDAPLEWVAFSLSSLLATCVGGVVAFYAHRRRITVAFDVALPVIALGCIAVAALSGVGPFAGEVLVAVGVQTIVVLAWVVLIGNSVTFGVPTNGIFALLAAFRHAGVFVGQALGSAGVLGAEGMAHLTLFALLLVAISLGHMQSRLAVSRQAMEGAAAGGPGEPSFAERAAALANECGLTPRERQVFMLWAAGHTGAHLQEELGITKNTLKTHLVHIYEKTGATNREELIALVERS